MIWLAENEPALYAVVHRWVDIKALVLHRLCGDWVVDHSMASATGLLDIADRRWHPTALGLAGLRPEQLPPLVGVDTTLRPQRSMAERLGLDLSTPIVVGGADGPLANLGVGALEPGVVACSIGTSGALRAVVDHPVVDHAGSLFCYALDDERWCLGGAITNGGLVLRWAEEALAPDAPGSGRDQAGELLAAAADVPPGSLGLIMLPYLLGERAP